MFAKFKDPEGVWYGLIMGCNTGNPHVMRVSIVDQSYEKIPIMPYEQATATSFLSAAEKAAEEYRHAYLGWRYEAVSQEKK
jgi:hypothetical protein